MARIFHYTNFEAALKIIETQSLLSTIPEKLNDPFECFPNIKTREEYDDVTWNNLIEENIKQNTEFYQGGYESWIERGQPVPIVDFLKNVNLNNLNIQQLVGKHFVFISFSKKGNSIPMWAHYGQNHTGVVFEFDTNEMPFSGLSMGGTIVDVDYINQLIKWEHLENNLLGSDRKKEMFNKIYRRKDPSWKYEEEVRIFMPNSLPDEPRTSRFTYKDSNGNLFLKYSPESLKNIYLGIRISQINSQILQRLLNSKFNHLTPIQLKRSLKKFDFIPFTDT